MTPRLISPSNPKLGLHLPLQLDVGHTSDLYVSSRAGSKGIYPSSRAKFSTVCVA